jgi:DNA-binding transcriptional regulator YiaG
MTSDRELLAALIAASGLTAAAFARLVLGRDERTVRRWQSGDTEIPDSAAEWLARATVESNGKSVRITVAR